MNPGTVLRAACACRQVILEARGAPIVTAICHCDDCQAAGRQIEALPGAAPVLDDHAGTPIVMFRKDRVACVQGQDRLVAHKLTPGSATSRYLASCCNSAMYLGFDDAKHWVDVFRDRIEGNPPRVQARVCTRFLPEGVEAPGDVPAYRSFPPGVIPRLLGARIAMMFGR